MDELYEQLAPEPIEDKRLRRLKEYLETEWGPYAVTNQMRNLFGSAVGYPPIPPPQRWRIPANLDLDRLIWEQLQNEAFIDEIWPSILMMLDDDTLNTMWAAQVATVLALHNIIKILPIILEKP